MTEDCSISFSVPIKFDWAESDVDVGESDDTMEMGLTIVLSFGLKGVDHAEITAL